MRTHYLLFGCFLFFFFRVAATPLFVLRCKDDQMDLPLEAHFDLTWRHLPGSLRQRVRTSGPRLRVLGSGIGVSLEGPQFLVLGHPRFFRQRSSLG